MNKAILLFSLLFVMKSLLAQDEKPSKFNLMAYGGIGFGVVENNNEPNYNLNTNNGAILLNYKFMKGLGVASGLGFNTLSGSGFNSIGNFYQERGLLQIPLLLTADADISEQLRFGMSFGPYANYIIKDEFRYLNNTEKDVFSGWNYGMLLNFGFFFNLSEDFSIGLNYSGQTDFSSVNSNKDTGINDSQKIKYLNSLGIAFMIDF